MRKGRENAGEKTIKKEEYMREIKTIIMIRFYR